MNTPESRFMGLLEQIYHHLLLPQTLIPLIFLLVLVVVGMAIIHRNNLRSLKKRLALTREKIDELEVAETKHKIQLARLATLIRTERKATKEKLSLLEEARQELRLQFSTLAHEIFEDKSVVFQQQSGQNLETLLKPFNQQLETLRKEIQSTYINDTRERASLKKELLHLQKLNSQITEEANNLTNALKGDQKVQGNWGELVLERVLEQSGLRRGQEYEVQRGFRDAENNLLKPDVIVRLPADKDIVIDSKVSLTAWERYCNSSDENDKTAALRDLVYAIRNHITSLGRKKYEDLKGLRSLDLVILFMPIEAAFSAACIEDDSLLTEAFSQKVVVVTPTTLLATLRTVENLWRYEHQSRNSLEIARRAGTLYDKFRGFVEEMEKIGKQLNTCHLTYDGAMNKLSQGRGNLISQARQLTELGVQVKKELPRSITETAETEQLN